jgi:hypothetical protein
VERLVNPNTSGLINGSRYALLRVESLLNNFGSIFLISGVRSPQIVPYISVSLGAHFLSVDELDTVGTIQRDVGPC